MKLFEAIVEANHRAVAGDQNAGYHLADYADELPIVALTCIDPRLNPLFPDVLGVTKDQFIWLRNAGNIIHEPMSSMTRSLALACAVKGGREIAIIGHTDCQVRKTSVMALTEAFRALGVDRSAMPENLTEFFGLFASEQQNVIKGVTHVRHSPLIGAKIPVHGLLVDINTGKLDWVVNGYQTFATAANPEVKGTMNGTDDAFKSLPDFKMGEMKFPETKIGELVAESEAWLSRSFQPAPFKPLETATPVAPAEAPKPPSLTVRPPPIAPRIPTPPIVRPGFKLPPNRKF